MSKKLLINISFFRSSFLHIFFWWFVGWLEHSLVSLLFVYLLVCLLVSQFLAWLLTSFIYFIFFLTIFIYVFFFLLDGGKIVVPDMWWWKMVYLNVRYIQFTEMSGKDIRVVKCIPHKMFLGGTRAPCMNTYFTKKQANMQTQTIARTHIHTQRQRWRGRGREFHACTWVPSHAGTSHIGMTLTTTWDLL